MSKYQPLEKYLVEKGFDEVPLTFEQIESVVGCDLPASARKYRAWWSNNSGNSVMTHAWIAAGYRSARVNLEGERVVFIKTAEQAAVRPQPPKPAVTSALFGCMAGTVTINVSVDLTAPAQPDWPEVTHPVAGDLNG